MGKGDHELRVLAFRSESEPPHRSPRAARSPLKKHGDNSRSHHGWCQNGLTPILNEIIRRSRHLEDEVSRDLSIRTSCGTVHGRPMAVMIQ